MKIELEKREITTILSALKDRPYMEVAALIRKIVEQTAKEETELRRRKERIDMEKSKSVFYGDAER